MTCAGIIFLTLVHTGFLVAPLMQVGPSFIEHQVPGPRGMGRGIINCLVATVVVFHWVAGLVLSYFI